MCVSVCVCVCVCVCVKERERVLILPTGTPRSHHYQSSVFGLFIVVFLLHQCVYIYIWGYTLESVSITFTCWHSKVAFLPIICF